MNFTHMICILERNLQDLRAILSQMHLVYYLNDLEWIWMRFENLFVFRYTLLGLPKVIVFLQKKGIT